MKILLLALCIGLATLAQAREWTDTKGRKFHGVLADVAGDQLAFMIYGDTQLYLAQRKTSCEADRTYVAAWEKARASAVVLNANVVWSRPEGALIEGGQFARLPEAPPTKAKWFSPLAVKWTPEKQIADGWAVGPFKTLEVFVEGLSDTKPDQKIRFLVAWPAGTHEFITSIGLVRQVPKYTLTPPSR